MTIKNWVILAQKTGQNSCISWFSKPTDMLLLQMVLICYFFGSIIIRQCKSSVFRYRLHIQGVHSKWKNSKKCSFSMFSRLKDMVVLPLDLI